MNEAEQAIYQMKLSLPAIQKSLDEIAKSLGVVAQLLQRLVEGGSTGQVRVIEVGKR